MKKKKSLVGWTEDTWNLYRGITQINHTEIWKEKKDCIVPQRVRITIEKL